MESSCSLLKRFALWSIWRIKVIDSRNGLSSFLYEVVDLFIGCVFEAEWRFVMMCIETQNDSPKRIARELSFMFLNCTFLFLSINSSRIDLAENKSVYNILFQSIISLNNVHFLKNHSKQYSLASDILWYQETCRVLVFNVLENDGRLHWLLDILSIPGNWDRPSGLKPTYIIITLNLLFSTLKRNSQLVVGTKSIQWNIPGYMHQVIYRLYEYYLK